MADTVRKVFYLWYVFKFKPEFLNLGPIDNLCLKIHSRGGFSGLCMMLSSTPGPYSRDASSQYPSHTRMWEPNISPDIAKSPCEGKIALGAEWRTLVWTIPHLFFNTKLSVNTVPCMHRHVIIYKALYMASTQLIKELQENMRKHIEKGNMLCPYHKGINSRETPQPKSFTPDS